MANPARFAADLASKMASDPRILQVILDNAPGIRAASPDLAMRLDDGDPNAVLEAYQMIVAGGGKVAAPARQLSLPLDQSPTGMIPYGVRGPGTPVGGPTGSGTIVPPPTGLTTQVQPRLQLPEPPRRLPEPQRRLPEPPRKLPAPQRALSVPERVPQDAPPLRLESPDALADRRAMDELSEAVAADEAAARMAHSQSPNGRLERARQVAERVVRKSAIPAAAAGVGGAAWTLMQEDADAPAVDAGEPVAPRMVPDVTRKPKPFSTADLAAETSPPPSVAVQDEPITLDYAQMARDKIRQANEIQLREGRITPESAALTREADALYQKAAEARRTGFHPPIMPVEQQNEQTSAIRARQRRAG